MPEVRKRLAVARGKDDGHNFTVAICLVGIDIMAHLPQGKKQVKFLLVAIDYFMKCVEAEALATITEAKIQNFVWKNIMCRFEMPRTIISDNGCQFDS